MTNVTIHGKLGKIFGENHKFQVEKMSEVANAIEANSRGFKNKILSDLLAGDNYCYVDPKKTNRVYKRPEEFLDSKPPEELHIVPVISGEAEAIIGFIVRSVGIDLAAGAAAGSIAAGLGTALEFIGVALIVQGISKLLFPIDDPRIGSMNQESAVDTSSYIFSSLRNNAVQGFPIPLLYGELRIGSNIISTNVVSEDLGDTATQNEQSSGLSASVGGSTSGGGTGGSDQSGGSDTPTPVETTRTPAPVGGEDDTSDPVTSTLTPNIPTVDGGSSQTTTDTTPTFTGNVTMSDGSVQAGVIVELHIQEGRDPVLLASSTTDSDGNFSITIPKIDPRTGAYTFRFRARIEGITPSNERSVSVTIQSTQDSSPTNDPTNLRQTSNRTVARVTVTGNAEANSTVTMRKATDNSLLATGTANANGIFNLTSNTALSNATHTLRFIAEAQGKEPSSIVTLNVTVNVPSPPADETTVDDDDNIVISDEGSVSADEGGSRFDPGINLVSTPSDTTPTFQGNVTSFGSSFGAGTTVQGVLFVPGSQLGPSTTQVIGEVTADANGDFELTSTLSIQAGIPLQLGFNVISATSSAAHFEFFANSSDGKSFQIQQG